MNNMQRSNRFEVTVLAFRAEYGDDVETIIIDFLADARHWCHGNDQSFAELDRLAHQHYLAECDEQTTQERDVQ